MEPQEKRIREITFIYYSMPEIRKALLQFSQNRECVPSYMMESFGKRPDTFQYEQDILEQVKKGATSFHCSEEIWDDPLEISTELPENETNELRTGWDLLLDVDSPYLEYSKICAQLLIQALEFHGVENIGIKFSGNKGFHIIIPWNAFPEEIYNQKTKNMFPEWPRLICQYLNEMIRKKLIEEISDLMHKDREPYVKDFEAPKKVMPDILLVSARHLFRMPYSLHEKTALASIVIDKDKINAFQITDAKPFKTQIKNFYPNAKLDEAKELLLQALDWKEQKQTEETKGKTKFSKDYKEIKISDLSENLFPPCIKLILNGMKQDGRKRALFILMNFFKSLKLSDEEIQEKINKWNEKNYKPLKQGYIQSQFNWYEKSQARLPPNCDKPNYKDLAICKPEEICRQIKNPINYVFKRFFRSKRK